MRARDLIVIARRRAGLTQMELGRRLGAPQATVARWESGATEPKFETVREVVRACGLDLSIGLPPADDSWVSLIDEQLRRAPAERVRHLTHDGFDRVAALELAGVTGLRAVVIGEAAGALHGWPLILSSAGTVDLVVHPDDRVLAEEAIVGAALQPDRVRLIDAPRGTLGYADLARGAEEIDVGVERVEIAALVDLLRIALATPGSQSGQWALALEKTLDVRSPDRSMPRGGRGSGRATAGVSPRRSRPARPAAPR